MASPHKLGRYELLEQLGEGGMGAVWLARLTGTGGFEKLCIVKTVLPAIAKDASFVSRFLHEGRVLTQLQHSNIAQVFDMGEEGETLYLALEYVAGIDLARLHQHVRESEQALPLPVCVYLVQQAAEGLGAAHRKTAVDGSPLNVVHRDVSPQNLMVSYEGEVKVIDFGIAKSEARSKATGTPTVMGKLGYMAPEQARGENVDHRADQYALGIVLWELLANRPFVPRGTLTEMVVAMANPALKPLAPLRPEVPQSLETVVLKALAPQPEHRYASTDDFARALLDELLKLSGMPSKVQVGEFVKQFCASEFKSTQALLTRVSTIRGLPTGVAHAKTDGLATPASAEETDPTLVKPTGQHGAVQRATPASPPPPQGVPMTTAQLQAAALPPSRAPLFIGAGLVAALLLAGGAYVLTRPRHKVVETPPATPAPTTKALDPVAEPVKTTDPTNAPPANTPPVNEPPVNEPPEVAPVVVPPVAEVVKAAAGDVVEAKKMVELFVDAGKTYVRAGQGDSLVVGSTLVIVGAPQADGKRTQVGTATVMEVFPKMSRVALDEAAAQAEGARFAALGDVKVTAAPKTGGPSTVEVKKAVELFKDADKTYARAGTPEGLVVGQTLTIVSGPTADGKRTKLGTGTVMEVFPKMARLALDAEASAASGDRFVAIGEVKEVVAPSNALDVKKAVEIFADGDKTYARAGKPEGLVAGQELVIVGPPQNDGKRQKLGTATVMEVQGKLARVLLDPEAGKAAGARFAALDASSAAPASAGTGTPARGGAPAVGSMTGLLKLQTQPIWSVYLTNTSKFAWNNCTLFAPGQRRMMFPSLVPGARREFPVNLFVFDPTAPNLINEVQVGCKEGTFRIQSQ
ncbi:MAG: serine/threonine protein kinase [Myxococcaceae bacterium]|nr:serine/threonine protein kinase [Myxococcaceae bacterium]